MAKPIITTDVPGCREVVTEGVTGFLCEPRSSGSLVDAMKRMLAASPAETAEMGSASRRTAEERFAERIAVERYLRAIERALEGGR